MKRKVITILLALTCTTSLLLSGCGSCSNADTTSDSAKAESISDSGKEEKIEDKDNKDDKKETITPKPTQSSSEKEDKTSDSAKDEKESDTKPSSDEKKNSKDSAVTTDSQNSNNIANRPEAQIIQRINRLAIPVLRRINLPTAQALNHPRAIPQTVTATQALQVRLLKSPHRLLHSSQLNLLISTITLQV